MLSVESFYIVYFSLLGLQVANLWSFCLVHFPTSPRTVNRTWSNASRWPWRVGRSACVGENRGWRRLWGNLSASAFWSAAISSATSAGIVVWMAVEAFWNEVRNCEKCDLQHPPGVQINSHNAQLCILRVWKAPTKHNSQNLVDLYKTLLLVEKAMFYY